MIDIILILLLSIAFSVSPFLKKNLLHTFKVDEMLSIRYLFLQAVLLTYFIYKFFFTKDKLNYFKKIKIYHLSHFIILVGISIVSAIIYHVLIDNKNISHIIPILSPTIILITLIISFFIYEEHLEIHEIFGILLIILGIIIVKSKTFLTND